MSNLIATQSSGVIVDLILNRADQRNALTWPMLLELEAALDLAERTPAVRAVIVRGEGRGFSSGIDLQAFANLADIFGVNWRGNMLSVTGAFQRIVTRFERSPLPTIALVHGYALGLGLELALACDFRLVASGTRLSLPEARLGIIPDVGGTTRLTRLVGPARAKELILTGKMIGAEQAAQWGLVTAVVPPDELRATGEALIADLIQCAPLAVTLGKRVIDGVADIDRGLQLEAWAQNQLIQTEDFTTGVQAVMLKTAPEWKGK